MANDDLTISLDGESYSVNDFEGRELVAAERAFDISLFSELQRGSVTGVYALIFIIKRRKNPEFTAEQALALPLGEIDRMVDQPKENGGPPPNRAARRARPAKKPVA